MADRSPKGQYGKTACQKTGDRAQVYGAVRREIRVTRRRSDYLKPSLQKMQVFIRRKDT